MKILAVSTSSDILGVCVAEDKKIIAGFDTDAKRKHSVILLPVIDEMLGRAGLDIADMDVLACDTGPGSFTGIRIGVSTINAMSIAVKRPVIGIPSLDILAGGVSASYKNTASCIYARNDQVYGGIYPDNWKDRIYFAGPIEEFIGRIRDLTDGEILLVGDGSMVFKDKFREGLYGKVFFSDDDDNHIRAEVLARMSFDRNAENGFLSPFYLKHVSAREKGDGQ